MGRTSGFQAAERQSRSLPRTAGFFLLHFLSIHLWRPGLSTSSSVGSRCDTKEARAYGLRGLESDSQPCPSSDDPHSRCFPARLTFSSSPQAGAYTLLLPPHACGPGGSTCETISPSPQDPGGNPCPCDRRRAFRWSPRETDGGASFLGIQSPFPSCSRVAPCFLPVLCCPIPILCTTVSFFLPPFRLALISKESKIKAVICLLVTGQMEAATS